MFHAKKHSSKKLKKLAIPKSLRGITNSFTVYRLFSIYSCLSDILDSYENTPLVDLELIADVSR